MHISLNNVNKAAAGVCAVKCNTINQNSANEVKVYDTTI